MTWDEFYLFMFNRSLDIIYPEFLDLMFSIVSMTNKNQKEIIDSLLLDLDWSENV